ncbi:MAG: hypothetical protein HYU57_07040 [Micavibrio aeruginosavorus]|nr:hypothetical protein [Micavibrio aeruginosavorus]
MEYRRQKIVISVLELAETEFSPDVNMVLLPRLLSGDFNRLAARAWSDLKARSMSIDLPYDARLQDYLRDIIKPPSFLKEIFITEAEKTAARQVLKDMEDMQAGGYKCYLRLVSPRGYKANVENFHIDGPPDTYASYDRALCCYAGPTTEYLNNEDAASNGRGGYNPLDDSQVMRFQNGELWKHATRNMKDVLPFIHRAPKGDGDVRMLLFGVQKLKF